MWTSSINGVKRVDFLKLNGKIIFCWSTGGQSATNSVNSFFSTIAGPADDDNFDIGIRLIALECYQPYWGWPNNSHLYNKQYRLQI